MQSRLDLNSWRNPISLMPIHDGNDFRFNHPRLLDHLPGVLDYQRLRGQADSGTARFVVRPGTPDSRGLGLVSAGISGTAFADESGVDAAHGWDAVDGCGDLLAGAVHNDLGAPDTRG